MRKNNIFYKIRSVWFILTHADRICDDLDVLNGILDMHKSRFPDSDLTKTIDFVVWEMMTYEEYSND